MSAEASTRRAVLRAELARVEAEIAERLDAAAPGEARPGFGKRAGDYVAQVVDDRTNYQLADSLTVTAGAIREALAALDEGRYGTCTSCGAAIDAARLEAVPWARSCMVCQSRRADAGQLLRRRTGAGRRRGESEAEPRGGGGDARGSAR